MPISESSLDRVQRCGLDSFNDFFCKSARQTFYFAEDISTMGTLERKEMTMTLINVVALISTYEYT